MRFPPPRGFAFFFFFRVSAGGIERWTDTFPILETREPPAKQFDRRRRSGTPVLPISRIKMSLPHRASPTVTRVSSFTMLLLAHSLLFSSSSVFSFRFCIFRFRHFHQGNKQDEKRKRNNLFSFVIYFLCIRLLKSSFHRTLPLIFPEVSLASKAIKREYSNGLIFLRGTIFKDFFSSSA